MQQIRPPAVSGVFYPENPRQLLRDIDQYLQPWPSEGDQPKALVVPHAGYIYSGPIAGAAYQRLLPWAERIRRVVTLGPSHRVPLRGLAVPEADSFHTPLGDIPLDTSAIAELSCLPQVVRSDLAHQFEHSIEVQLPFLQRVLPEFQLVPLVVGDASSGDVAEVIEMLWGGNETLFVISSDLSHYHSYHQAQSMDRKTAENILEMTGGLEGEQACGCYALNGWLREARQHHLRAQQLALANSGDTAGDKARVVGYGAWSFV